MATATSTITIPAHYRWIDEGGTHTYTGGYAEIDCAGIGVDDATEARLYMIRYTRQDNGQITGEEAVAASPGMPQLIVTLGDTRLGHPWDARITARQAGERERRAVRRAGYTLKEDVDYYAPWAPGEAEAARRYWDEQGA
jgi:hypothetical protein